MFSAAKSMDANQWFHIVGLISAFALGIGFVTGLISVALSWKINRDQATKMAQLELALAEQKERTANAEHELEKERRARLEIERQLAPRLLSSKEEKIISDAIRPYAGHHAFIISLVDAEVAAYRGQISKVLEASGWQLSYRTGAFSQFPYGVKCVVSDKPDKAVQALLSAFDKARIKPTIEASEKLPPDHIEILIGRKPPLPN